MMSTGVLETGREFE